MNKISLISLALSFLFTLTSGCVHSSDGEDSSVSTEQAANDNSSESTEAKADDSEKKSSEKKSKKKRRGVKSKRHAKSSKHRASNSKGSQYTENLNKQSLGEAQTTESAK